ncbi:hypothetical protein CGCF413_v008876 [Colletotrichum fructicola]|nr:hypothetical protein CGCF413_v008876 [Colletotrichum fructicola]
MNEKSKDGGNQLSEFTYRTSTLRCTPLRYHTTTVSTLGVDRLAHPRPSVCSSTVFVLPTHTISPQQNTTVCLCTNSPTPSASASHTPLHAPSLGLAGLGFCPLRSLVPDVAHSPSSLSCLLTEAGLDSRDTYPPLSSWASAPSPPKHRLAQKTLSLEDSAADRQTAVAQSPPCPNRQKSLRGSCTILTLALRPSGLLSIPHTPRESNSHAL